MSAAGIEEVTLLLEDMGLNLQSMMASRFVRPFAEEVRKWEQRLSLVSECIEVWMLVQRKWMYLESIFMDSDDIRHQLPQVYCPLLHCRLCKLHLQHGTLVQAWQLFCHQQCGIRGLVKQFRLASLRAAPSEEYGTHFCTKPSGQSLRAYIN